LIVNGVVAQAASDNNIRNKTKKRIRPPAEIGRSYTIAGLDIIPDQNSINLPALECAAKQNFGKLNVRFQLSSQNERNKRRNTPAVCLVRLSELLVQQVFLQPKFAPQSQRRKRDGEDCSPFPYRHRGTYKCEQKPSVYGATNQSVRAVGDELVIFLDAHSTTPI
jgi:hypothetical protein